ncbi:MAG: hypothetical protein ABSB88_20310 [Bryobacteraceae bacterium]
MMKRLLLLLASAGVMMCADLANVRSLYVLPMSHGLDQYIANRLTNEHVFTIVTDPKLADAVLTDHVGTSLQAKLADLLQPAPAEKPAPKADETGKEGPPEGLVSLAESISKTSSPADSSSISRSKGTVFLVDTKSRQVVWSAYDLPKDTSSKELDRTASDIVSRIKKDLNPKKK